MTTKSSPAFNPYSFAMLVQPGAQEKLKAHWAAVRAEAATKAALKPKTERRKHGKKHEPKKK